MIKPTMQAIQMQDYGGPEALKLEQVPTPQPGEGQVMVRVMAAGVNPADWKFGSGAMKQFMPLQFPWTPGLEGAGVVEAVGAGVTRFQPGQAVFGRLRGSYAEYAMTQEDDLIPKPDNLTFEQAATITVGALTAWGAIVDMAQVQPDQRVLVHGGAGGVGAYIVQLARWKGAHVIATASTANTDFARGLGADQVIDYTAGPFEQAIHDIDVVIDTVGGEIAQRSVQTLIPGGLLIEIAGRLPPDLGKDRGIRTTNVQAAGTDKLAQIVPLIQAGTIQPIAGKVLPLSEACQAWEQSLTGHGRGRIVLKIGD